MIVIPCFFLFSLSEKNCKERKDLHTNPRYKIYLVNHSLFNSTIHGDRGVTYVVKLFH